MTYSHLTAALTKLAGLQVPITETVTHRTQVSISGHFRVDDPAQRETAIAQWENRWAGYMPRCYPDATDPCLAIWSRDVSCE